jgi:hypothetical protein
MDELQAVRELFGECPPPSAEVTARARAALLSPRSRPHRAWWPRVSSPRRALLRAGLPASVAAATAAVVTAVVVTSGTVRAPATGLGIYHLPAGASVARLGTAAAGRKILLTAASTVAREKPGTIGRYWEDNAVIGNFIRVGPAGDRYTILEKTASQQWTASGSAASTDIVRALGVQIATAASRAAWRRDGSPTTWDINPEISVAAPDGVTSGFSSELSAAPGNWTGVEKMWTGTGRTFAFGDTNLTARELLKLPANPAQLKAIILRAFRSSWGSAGQKSILFQVTPWLLTMPVTPAVRSALYQMLAGLPGVRSLGEVRDVAGQRGIGVALTTNPIEHCGYHGWITANGGGATGWTFSSCVVQQRLVIDPGTGLPLAQELRYLQLPPGQSWPAPDGLFSFQLFGTAQWTNASPPHVH